VKHGFFHAKPAKIARKRQGILVERFSFAKLASFCELCVKHGFFHAKPAKIARKRQGILFERLSFCKALRLFANFA
jgi:hypothetical protein